MIGSSVKDFGSFYQKPLEAILYKASRQLVCLVTFELKMSLNRDACKKPCRDLTRFFAKANVADDGHSVSCPCTNPHIKD